MGKSKESSGAEAPETSAPMRPVSAYRETVQAWEYASAAALHGWAQHKHAMGSEMELSADDFQRAVAAASAPVVKPHPAALSEHKPKFGS